MSGTSEAGDAGMSGLPLVLDLGSAFHRCRVATGGRIVSVISGPEANGSAARGYRCVLEDGTGRIDLLFIGRTHVPGLDPGASCHVEGTARMDHGRLTIWNPLYRLEPAAASDIEQPRRSGHG